MYYAERYFGYPLYIGPDAAALLPWNRHAGNNQKESALRVHAPKNAPVRLAPLNEVCLAAGVQGALLRELQRLFQMPFPQAQGRIGNICGEVHRVISSSMSSRPDFVDELSSESPRRSIGPNSSVCLFFPNNSGIESSIVHLSAKRKGYWKEGMNHSIYKIYIDSPGIRIMTRETIHAIFDKMAKHNYIEDQGLIDVGREAFHDPRDCDGLIEFLYNNPVMTNALRRVRHMNSLRSRAGDA